MKIIQTASLYGIAKPSNTKKKNCLKQLTHLKFIELLFLIYTLCCRWFRYLILSLKENLTIQEKHKESFLLPNIIFWVELIFVYLILA